MIPTIEDAGQVTGDCRSGTALAVLRMEPVPVSTIRRPSTFAGANQ